MDQTEEDFDPVFKIFADDEQGGVSREKMEEILPLLSPDDLLPDEVLQHCTTVFAKYALTAVCWSL